MNITEILKIAKQIKEDDGAQAAYFYLIGSLDKFKPIENIPKITTPVSKPKTNIPKRYSGTRCKNQVFRMLQTQDRPVTVNELMDLINLEYDEEYTRDQIYIQLYELVEEHKVDRAGKKGRQVLFIINHKYDGKIQYMTGVSH